MGASRGTRTRSGLDPQGRISPVGPTQLEPVVR